MTKPTDEEAAARRALAHKVAIDLREQLLNLDSEARRKCPDLDAIRSTCETISQCMDGHLTAYDHKHGTASERTATKFRLRILNSKLVRHTDELSEIVERQQAHSKKRDALLSDGVQIIEALVDLCTRNGVAIPPDLMGPPECPAPPQP